MIPRDCKPIGYVPPLSRIDLNPPRPIEQVPMRADADEAMVRAKRKAKHDRIWKLVQQASESA